MTYTLPPFARATANRAHASIDREALLAHVPTNDGYRYLISGPYDLAVYLRLVDEFLATSSNAVETDLFVWSRGMPEDPAITRLGGLPYLPADEPWPVHMDCPGSFLGQIDFRDSRDLIGETAGDVLMVFQFLDLYDTLDCKLWERECFRGVWTTVDDRPRVDAASQCADPFSNSILHGVRCRTLDRLEAIDEDGNEIPMVAPATKIGGHVYDAQSAWAKVPAGHRFLGQLCAIWPRHDTPYPSVDCADPFPGNVPDDKTERAHWQKRRDEFSSWGEGFLSIYIDDAGAIRFAHSFT